MKYPVVSQVSWCSGPILTSVQRMENIRLCFPDFFTTVEL